MFLTQIKSLVILYSMSSYLCHSWMYMYCVYGWENEGYWCEMRDDGTNEKSLYDKCPMVMSHEPMTWVCVTIAPGIPPHKCMAASRRLHTAVKTVVNMGGMLIYIWILFHNWRIKQNECYILCWDYLTIVPELNEPLHRGLQDQHKLFLLDVCMPVRHRHHWSKGQ